MDDLLTNSVAMLAMVCGALVVWVLNLRHQLRVARDQANWNAALATRAKASLREATQGLRLLGDECERVNRDLSS